MINLSMLLSNDSVIQIPTTMKLDRLIPEADYEIHRAPFSSALVVSGDGLPKPEPFVVEGMVYPGSTAAATTWIQNFSSYVQSCVALRLTDESNHTTAFPVLGADITILPVGLARVLKVTMRFFPETI